jgi:hypothetical protein
MCLSKKRVCPVDAAAWPIRTRNHSEKCKETQARTRYTVGIAKVKMSYHSPGPSLRDGLELDPAAAAEANVDGAIAVLRGC